MSSRRLTSAWNPCVSLAIFAPSLDLPPSRAAGRRTYVSSGPAHQGMARPVGVLAIRRVPPDSEAMSPALERRVIAVLGPTNTGKTHFAIERMLGHRSGMIGFPLRLLARENYDKVRRLRGARSVALITGEERILPPRPA